MTAAGQARRQRSHRRASPRSSSRTAPRFRACFDKWSRQHPGVNGRVTLIFYLDPDGNLDEPNAEDKGFAAPEVATCIEERRRASSRYPESASGKFTRFTYPFDFKAAR